MTKAKQQRLRLAANRNSQRMALREHCLAGVKSYDPIKPAVASKCVDSGRPFNAYLRLPKNAA